MKFDIPPVARSQRSGFLDEKILQISGELFENKLFGLGVTGFVNILFIYLWYKRVSFVSICSFLFLYYLIIRAIQIKILGW
jgi:hypothetical protein